MIFPWRIEAAIDRHAIASAMAVGAGRIATSVSLPWPHVSNAHSDPALDALLLPFRQGDIPWPEGPVLFLRARDGWALRQFPLGELLCEQGFKPDADALVRSGLEVVEDASSRAPADGYALVLVLPPRQREEARSLFARALSLAASGGMVIASMPNDEGAKAGEGDLKRLATLSGSLSKHHCRVFWARRSESNDEALRTEWLRLDLPRPILGGRFVSRPGVFAWDRIDVASALLAAHLPADLAGHGADLGAGYGFLSSEVLARCPGVTALDLYEAEARALNLARGNLHDASAALVFHWHDVTTGVPGQYDFIVMNPPFHAQGREDRPDIGRRFIEVAAAALKPRGRLWLVANRHLPYESALGAGFGQVRTVAGRDGFKVIEAVKAGRA